MDRHLQIPENKKHFKIFPLDDFRIEMWIRNSFLANIDSIHNAAPNQIDFSNKDIGKRKHSDINLIQNSHEEFWHYLTQFYLHLKKSKYESSEYIWSNTHLWARFCISKVMKHENILYLFMFIVIRRRRSLVSAKYPRKLLPKVFNCSAWWFLY